MKNVFKTKAVYAAMLAGLGAVGAAGSASAVHINPDGLGQVLIYPYYTARNDFDTYLSVVNTTASTKAVKVRFIEGKNSREVLDFNLYLSPYDMWTGAIVETTNGAKLITADKSCTQPPIPAAGKDFVNFAYTGILQDGEDSSLDRTREGYFEIIEMGDVTDTDYTGWIKHNNGVPDNCAAIAALDAATDWDFEIVDGSGGLTGSASLVAPEAGTDYAYNAVAIEDWTATSEWTTPDSVLPNLGSGSVLNSDVFVAGGVVSSNWLFNIDATSAVMMRNNVINEFVLDAGTLSGTDWVVTFPTKWAYVGLDTDFNSVTGRDHDPAFDPFTENFGIGGSCDEVSMSVHDREEFEEDVDFSPLPPGAINTLCWESNVITFNDSDVLGSTNSMNVNTSFENGWMNLTLDVNPWNQLVSREGDSYDGLPVVGFMVQDFVNNNAAAGVMATYGGNFDHRYTRDIVEF